MKPTFCPSCGMQEPCPCVLSIRQRAEALLEIHRGACFVIDGNELQPAFREMEAEGLVTVLHLSAPTPGINIRRKGFSAKRWKALEAEPLAH